ncbi:molecular chaperone DjlA, partial [Klebsiella pneumoniae]|uniref:TerB family tellurite resistance protein n=1 Tax=Klebsiella pneumoniae TaxID=573 RepID=UPI000D88C64F
EPYAEQIAGLFRHNPAVLEELLDTLFLIALADGVAHPAALEYLHGVGAIYGFDGATFERIHARHLERDAADPYEILGVGREAPGGEIKAAY